MPNQYNINVQISGFLGNNFGTMSDKLKTKGTDYEQRVMKSVVDEVGRNAIMSTRVFKRTATGRLRRSISYSSSGLSGYLNIGVPYAGYREFEKTKYPGVRTRIDGQSTEYIGLRNSMKKMSLIVDRAITHQRFK